MDRLFALLQNFLLPSNWPRPENARDDMENARKEPIRHGIHRR